ncbi:MAG: STAS domain-containing protein [Nannocystis sp.]|nr:STAS domain-containing protein [Nannocystis sp.]MBA3547182.1 STAS domain-containing protein [Nannocystis sp.]
MPEDLLGRRLLGLTGCPGCSAARAARAAGLLGERKIAEFRAPNSAGVALDLEVRARRTNLGASPVVLLELRDVTAYKQAQKALVDSKKQLENAVLVRTRELQAKLGLIEKQQKSLLELSTPVIQVWDRVLVLPLIGEIDGDRAAQVTESVLATIARTGSRHVIIDLTGVPELGDAASAAMLRTIRAVQLLGAECSLTSISARVAASLVHRDVDWSRTVRMFADLQAALKVAIADDSRT